MNTQEHPPRSVWVHPLGPLPPPPGPPPSQYAPPSNIPPTGGYNQSPQYAGGYGGTQGGWGGSSGGGYQPQQPAYNQPQENRGQSSILEHRTLHADERQYRLVRWEWKAAVAASTPDRLPASCSSSEEVRYGYRLVRIHLSNLPIHH